MNQFSEKFDKVHQVKTGLWDGDSFGTEWQLHLVVYETDKGYEVWKDDGKGNGTQFAKVANRMDALEILNAFRRAYPE